MKIKKCKCGLVKTDDNIQLFVKNKNICKQCYNIKRKEYYNKNKDYLNTRRRGYYNKNKDKLQTYANEYYHKNKDKHNEICRKYKARKRKEDILYKLTENIRSSLGNSFRKKGYRKSSKTFEILGCTFEEFKVYIEKQFEPWMNWNNHGLYNGEFNYGWDLDHIIPLSSAETLEDVIELNHYTNFQPLCSHINRNIKK